jgi:hypothetical protein
VSVVTPSFAVATESYRRVAVLVSFGVTVNCARAVRSAVIVTQLPSISDSLLLPRMSREVACRRLHVAQRRFHSACAKVFLARHVRRSRLKHRLVLLTLFTVTVSVPVTRFSAMASLRI